MKFVTVRLLVDDRRAARLEAALETTTRGDGRVDIAIEPDTLDSYKIEDKAYLDDLQLRAAAWRPRRRIKACVENWPGAETGTYDPRCCRWPKSCSASVYDEQHVTDDDLEARR